MTLFSSAKLVVLATACAAFSTGACATDNTKLVNMPLSALQWKTSNEGVGFAALEGNRFEESYMAMVRLPAGLISPAHVKSANMYGLVVSGTITNISVGGDQSSEVELTSGSFYKIPANLPHISKCVSQVDCITFLYQDDKFDFLPVTK